MADLTGDVPVVRPDYYEPNYDKEKIAPYTLEDPLTFSDGRKVKTPDEWKLRRKEILGIFAREMYGAEPPPPEKLLIDKIEEKPDAMAGFAVRAQYRMRFSPDGKGGERKKTVALAYEVVGPQRIRVKASASALVSRTESLPVISPSLVFFSRKMIRSSPL